MATTRADVPPFHIIPDTTPAPTALHAALAHAAADLTCPDGAHQSSPASATAAATTHADVPAGVDPVTTAPAAAELRNE